MIINSSSFENIKLSDYQNLPTRTLNREFGYPNDNIELTIYDGNGEFILTDKNFIDYTPIVIPNSQYYKSIDIDYVQVLRDYGFTSGKYKTQFSFQRKVLDERSNRPSCFITEISPSRTEIKAQSYIEDDRLSTIVYNIQNFILTSAFVRDFNLNLGNGISSLILNIDILPTTPNTILIKLYDPLPSQIDVGSEFRIIEEIINPIELEIDMGINFRNISEGEDIKSPNFNIDISSRSSIGSEFKTYDSILQEGAVSSSFNNLVNALSSSFSLNLQFGNTNTPSGYHFENFVHFSSAVERLKNFEYKMRLMEGYRSELATLDSITGGITTSPIYIEDRKNTEDKLNKVIQNFDPYERFLYFESGTYSWPKYDNTKPYSNVSSSDAAVAAWLGVEIEGYNGQYTGGQLLSASRFDDQNMHHLLNTLPEHIQSNPDNSQYILFMEMVGHHFDNIWNYIESINDINKADSSLAKGISKDFVYDALSNTGIPAFDQFENANLFEYLLGGVKDGSFQYSSTDGSTMISASADSTLPKEDITKGIWKRLYHNAPYLLKTKGTERGIKALMACYGIPESMLHVKEYGGPVVDKTGFRTFSYVKDSLMLSPSLVGGGGTITDGSFPTASKTVQVRFLPEEGATVFDVINFSDSDGGFFAGSNDFSIGISQSIDNSLLRSESFAHLVIASGSNTGGANALVAKASSSLGPIFNGGVWNLSVILNSGSSEGNSVTAYATHTTFNKNTYVLSCSLEIPNYFIGANNNTFVSIGTSGPTGSSATSGTLLGPFSGSVQEYRAWFEKLSLDTIVTQSLSPFNYNGNTISSSYESLYLRLPLGSNGVDPIRNTQFNYAPQVSYHDIYTAKVSNTSVTRSLQEVHHLTTPDSVGSSMVSDKVRIDSGSVDEDWLSPFHSMETSTQDRQPNDFSDLGIFFSPTFEINEDIIYTLGAFRLDDYIGDPRHYASGSYPDLKDIRDIYTQKLERKYNFYDYIRTIQFFDHTLFKVIKSFTPAKANLKTGLVIEPHYLERAKIPQQKITREQQTEYLLSYTPSGSVSSTNETEHNAPINVVGYIESGSYGTAVENVAQIGIKSRYYFLR